MQQKEDRTSKVSIRWNVASKIRRNFYFSKKTVTNILAITEVKLKTSYILF